ncbi:MAG: PrsW family intramembrane metalloprotease [Microbacterium sp.]|uniref:PrsW family intramembrane metalloprotease n=1 Tax=Microbacterium sp. TaxID=51671 RepID=UPI002639D98A|nr:PrsW family intramembrane metalloprotease [Microbacterium sp.]MCX6501694.1 PrsW family intramembrane metalloprotease [Microbacterium sp.]
MSQPGHPPHDPRFASPLAQPTLLVPPPVAPPRPVTPRMELPRVRRTGAASIWIFALLAVLLVVLVAYFLAAIGPGSSLAGMLLALVPLVAVFFALRAVDRWEPEPRSLLALAVGWGAIASVVIALGVDLLLILAFGQADTFLAEAFSAVVQAPIVEELAKGLGVLLILLVGRRAFDGPVDGIVYGGLVGAGFAFTENIQYFAIAMIEGGTAELGTVFFLRGILSPFAHVMFTAVTGFAVGLAVRRGARGGGVFGAWLVGLIGAVALHALWNGSATFGDFFGLYAALQVPLFILFILGMLALRREEARLTRQRLGDYAATGWFTPEEVQMLATAPGRRAGLAWAARLPGDRRPQMRAFIREATALAAARQRLVSGRDPKAAVEEKVLLDRATAARAALFAR